MFNGEFDQTPGDWYIVIVRNEGKPYQKICVAAGPFETHAEAVDKLRETRNAANDCDGWTVWDTWYTGRLPERKGKPGFFTRRLAGAESATAGKG